MQGSPTEVISIIICFVLSIVKSFYDKINFSHHLVKVLHFIHQPLRCGKLDSKSVIAERYSIRYKEVSQAL
nr:MAG TPA: hypothetical protein [Caudoviricetes sp.]